MSRRLARASGSSSMTRIRPAGRAVSIGPSTTGEGWFGALASVPRFSDDSNKCRGENLVARGGISLSRLGWGRTTETLAQHNRHLGVAAAGRSRPTLQHATLRIVHSVDSMGLLDSLNRPRTGPARRMPCHGSGPLWNGAPDRFSEAAS